MEQLEGVFGKSTDAVFGINANGKIRYVNTGFEQLMGYSARQLKGCSCAHVLCGTYVHGEEFCGPNCPIPKMSAGQPEISDIDIVVRHANGNSILVNIGTCYVSNELQSHTGVDVLFSLRRINPERLLHRMVLPSCVNATAKLHQQGKKQLTAREKEILGLAVKGLNTREIAAQLFVSKQTVRSHFKNIYPKLGVNSRVEAVIVAMHYKLH